MKIVSYIVSAICLFFGILFIWGAFGTTFDGSALIIGLIMVTIGIVIIYAFSRDKKNKNQMEATYKVELGGDVNLNAMSCKQCGAPLSSANVKMIAGAPTVDCPYCGVSYQITEEPKW